MTVVIGVNEEASERDRSRFQAWLEHLSLAAQQ